MSTIGSGPGLGSGSNIELGTVRQVSTTDARMAPSTDTSSTATDTAKAVANSASGQAMVTSTALKAGSAPVDTDRVATIKHAIETGEYPIIPTKISDAMIAAGMLLRTAR